MQELAGPVRNMKPVLIRCLQFQIQAQLQRELVGADRLIRQGRVSIFRFLPKKNVTRYNFGFMRSETTFTDKMTFTDKSFIA